MTMEARKTKEKKDIDEKEDIRLGLPMMTFLDLCTFKYSSKLLIFTSIQLPFAPLGLKIKN